MHNEAIVLVRFCVELQENIQAMQAKDAALAAKRKHLEDRRNQSCSNRGGNISEMNARQKVLTKHAESLRFNAFNCL